MDMANRDQNLHEGVCFFTKRKEGMHPTILPPTVVK